MINKSLLSRLYYFKTCRTLGAEYKVSLFEIFHIRNNNNTYSRFDEAYQQYKLSHRLAKGAVLDRIIKVKCHFRKAGKKVAKFLAMVSTVEQFDKYVKNIHFLNELNNLMEDYGLINTISYNKERAFSIIETKMEKKLRLPRREVELTTCEYCHGVVRKRLTKVIEGRCTCNKCEKELKRCHACKRLHLPESIAGATVKDDENSLHCFECCTKLGLVLAYEDQLLHNKADLFYWESDNRYHTKKYRVYGIQRYGTTKPICLQRYSVNTVYCGLEIETMSPSDGLAVETANVVRDNFEGYIAGIEYDRSLTADPTDPNGPHIGGAEYITNFGTPLAHDSYIDKFCTILRSRGVVSHNDQRCGLHVHVSKTAEYGPVDVAKMILFWNLPENKSLIHCVARRYGTAYARLKPVDRTKPNEAVKSHGDPHKEIVNISNSLTVEVRAFRGSLNTTTVKACLSLSYLSWLFARNPEITVDDIHQTKFFEWCVNSKEREIKYCWHNLKRYLLEKDYFTISKEMSAKIRDLIGNSQEI